jgi:oligopeptide transport system ATP-binding protein
MDKALLRVENLVKHFPIKKGIVRPRQVGLVKAVDGISFSVEHGQTLGLVGESGCGKSTTGRTILRLIEPTSGKVFFEGQDILKLDKAGMRRLRRDMQIVFQDPYASLNPRMTVGDLIGEPLVLHGIAQGSEKIRRVCELLDLVGLSSRYMRRYPHEFSGGQRQRVGVARALALNPKVIVCDEPVSALDVSIQAQIINLLQDLQERLGLAYLFIAHDLSVVKHLSDVVAVMYLGKIVEMADKKELFRNPVHPYTEALLSSVPIPDPTVKVEGLVLDGDVPSPVDPPPGCRFRPRCRHAQAICATDDPPLIGTSHHLVACHVKEL